MSGCELSASTSSQGQFNKFTQISAQYSTDIPRDIISEYHDIIGPEGILDVLDNESFCHDKGHNVGKVIYEKTQNINEAMRICDTRCTSGCFHGVLMERFKEFIPEYNGIPADDGHEHVHLEWEHIKDELKNVCKQGVAKERYGLGDCVHGVGHAIMYLSYYDVEKAIGYCDLFEDKSLVYYCATGGYMERDLKYGEKDRDGRTPLYPCDTVKDHPAGCYRYKIRRALSTKVSNISGIAETCLTLPTSEEQAGCFHGVGMAYFKWIGKNPDKLEELCSYGDAASQRLCIEGAIGKLRVYSKQATLDACASMSGSLKAVCDKARTVGNFGMSRDFDVYYYKAPKENSGSIE